MTRLFKLPVDFGTEIAVGFDGQNLFISVSSNTIGFSDWFLIFFFISQNSSLFDVDTTFFVQITQFFAADKDCVISHSFCIKNSDRKLIFFFLQEFVS